MNSVHINISVGLLLACVSLLASCSDTSGIFGGGQGKVQKFYSADEPGRWEAQAANHEVNARIIVDAKGKKGIEVYVPFTKEMDERHYVEAIVLLDSNNRELAKKTFNRGEQARTIFEITDKIKFPVYVVSKCNMHEMWRKKITGKEKTRENEE
jgi:desulfoferrodoxin (superoxide reductase-like protein)